MLYLLLGSDDFSKKEFIEQLEKEEHFPVLNFFNLENPEELLAEALNSGLFSEKNIIRVEDFFSGKVLPEEKYSEFLEQISATENTVIFIEEKLDKRKTSVKELLKHKALKVLEFEIPLDEAFSKWVEQRAQKLGLNWDRQSKQVFLALLGAGQQQFGEPLYNLWQADSELRKLKIFAGTNFISADDVRALVSENLDENIFKVTNAIADKNKKIAAEHLADYLDRIPGQDEKTKVIALAGLLADQFRAILMIQSAQQRGLSDPQISAQTGFSPGRIFVLKKLARAFEQKKLLDALKKFEILDLEIKTSQNPAALQFFMIVDSVMK